MSREVRRVPLDFDAPVGETWAPLLMPESLYGDPCPDCRWEIASWPGHPGAVDGKAATGYTREAYAVAQTFYPHQIGGPTADALAWHDKLGQVEVDMLRVKGRLRVADGALLTAEQVNAANRSGSGMLGGLGHDGINRMLLVHFRCEQLGIPVACPTCEGETTVWRDAEHKAAYDTWTPPTVPEGDGWQLWETVSEGGPVTPVLTTAEALVDWLVEHGEHHSPEPYRREAAEALVRAGISFGTFLVTDGRLLQGGRDADLIEGALS
jgi:hypothetical protein